MVARTHGLGSVDGSEFADQDWVAFEQFEKIDLVDGVSGHIGGWELKSTINHQLFVLQPAAMSESL